MILLTAHGTKERQVIQNAAIAFVQQNKNERVRQQKCGGYRFISR